MRIAFTILFLGLYDIAFGQQSDTVRLLPLNEVLELARQHHPIIRQADLRKDFAEAELRTARGQMDPTLIAGYAEKQYKGTEYYQKLGGTLKIPTWFPLDPKVEVTHNQGEYLNPENYISPYLNYWQVSAGVSLPVGRGLFIDERRSLIQQAKIYGNLAEAERISLTNKTLLDIIKSYWDWYFAYREYQLMLRSIEIAENLFERVKMDYGFGEAAVIDTIQAKITYQNRRIDLRKAQLNLTQARLNFSIHLWRPDFVPLEVNENVVPTNDVHFGLIPPDTSIEALARFAVENHPDIRKVRAKREQLEVEQRWNRESLKPEINLSYSLIDAPFSYEGFESPEWFDNYKLGVDFYFPIFLRKERGKLQKTQLYLESTQYNLLQLQQRVYTGVQSSYAQLKTHEALVNDYQSMAENYQRLLDAELFNLKTGESDLFKLNIQQDKYIEAQLKYLEALIKLEKLKATLPYEIGLPNLSYKPLQHLNE